MRFRHLYIYINIIVETTRLETSSKAGTYLCRDFPRSQQWQHFRRLLPDRLEIKTTRLVYSRDKGRKVNKSSNISFSLPKL